MVVNFLIQLERRMLDDWRPKYCSDPRRRYHAGGFDQPSNDVRESDARDGLLAIDRRVVVDNGGRYRAALSSASEGLYWEGRNAATPRPIALGAGQMNAVSGRCVQVG